MLSRNSSARDSQTVVTVCAVWVLEVQETTDAFVGPGFESMLVLVVRLTEHDNL